VPAYIQNDANACALVEWKLGAGRGVDDMVFLTMGTGMGGGVIAGGRLLRGANDMAGEVGHLRLADDGPSGYGKAGSFEGFASGGGIDRQAQAFTRARIEAGAPAQWSLDGHAPESVNAALIADYARRGDPQARAIFEQAGRRLGQGLALIADALNPARIVIGSVFVRCEDLLRGPMEAALAEEALAPARAGLEVVPAQTGERLGDCAAVMDSDLQHPVETLVEMYRIWEHGEAKMVLARKRHRVPFRSSVGYRAQQVRRRPHLRMVL